MNNDINVEVSDLKVAATTILNELDNINKALDKAETAGNNALAAFGGSGTPAGGAVDSQMISINRDEFTKTKTSINNFLDSLTNVGNTYQTAEEDFVSKIKSYGANDQ